MGQYCSIFAKIIAGKQLLSVLINLSCFVFCVHTYQYLAKYHYKIFWTMCQSGNMIS